jgi:DNA-binding beta-propeller fold protein YncE/mono/diheme cytochrome c family protein
MKALALLLIPLLTPLHGRPVSLGLTPDATTALVAIEQPPSLRWLDAATLEPGPELKLPAKPAAMVVSPDGKLAFVTGGIAPGWLAVVDLPQARLLKTVPVGHSPGAAALAADGKTIWICDRFRNEVVALDWHREAELARHPVEREPVACALVENGATLLVANHLPTGRADTGNIAAAVSVLDTTSGASRSIPLPNGSTGVEGLALSPDGKFLYITHTLARYGLPTTQVDRGWMNTSAVSIIDVAARKRLASVLLDDIDRGAANPWGVACSPDGGRLHVAHAGTHEISTIDRTALHERLAKVAEGGAPTRFSRSLDDVSNDLSFLIDIRTRTAVPGRGPRALLAMAGGQLLTAGYFSGTVHLVGDGKTLTRRVSDPADNDPVSRGEAIFHDATTCFQQWQSCSTCHPGTRADSLNWDLLNDGFGNPRQAKSMLFTVQTPPSMITGVRADATTAIEAGFRHIQFTIRGQDEIDAVHAYLSAMQPVPSPALVDGKLSESASRGRAVFEATGCAACHSGPLFTDLQAYKIGDTDAPLDTPTLREVWRTAPYLYDGRAPTLKSIFTDPDHPHGETADLSEKEIDDLVEYVRSL